MLQIQARMLKFSTSLRVIGFILALLILIAGAIIWVFSSLQSVPALCATIFGALSTIIALLQLYPIFIPQKSVQSAPPSQEATPIQLQPIIIYPPFQPPPPLASPSPTPLPDPQATTRKKHPGPPRNPYKSLHFFSTKDAKDFYGRESLSDELVEKLKVALNTKKNGQEHRLLTVIGPSGSGKSSVVLAGLLPRLQRGALPQSDQWIYLDRMVPGTHPFGELAQILHYHFPDLGPDKLNKDELQAPSPRGLLTLANTLGKRQAIKVVLIIDQFEELFLQVVDDDEVKVERERFIESIVAACTELQGSLIVILILRADFYDRPMRFPQLFGLMQATLVHVLPMETHNLRDVIKRPAELPDVQLSFEGDLVGDILLEMQGQSGALPLLEFTLDRLFQLRKGRELTLAAYHDMGGVKKALAQHADNIFLYDLPSDEHRQLAEVLFLRLIDPGDFGQGATRRKVPLSELPLSDPGRTTKFDEVIQVFTDARLLTKLIIEDIATVEISHDAVIREWPRLKTWLQEAHEDHFLLHVIREDAAAWDRTGRLPERVYRGSELKAALEWKDRSLPSLIEEAFLQAGVVERDRLQLADLEAKRRERRLKRRAVLGGIIGLGLGMTGAGIIFHPFVNLQAKSPSLGLPYILQGHTATVNSVAWSPDDKHLASASSDHTVQVWDAITGTRQLIYRGHTDLVNSVAWSPDGRRIASASADATVQVWDAITGTHQLIYQGHAAVVNSVAWSSDGKHLASASADATVQVWDAITGIKLFIYIGHTDLVNSVAWSPDGKRLASASSDRTVQVWDAVTGIHQLTYQGHTEAVNSVAWSPDGKRLASASNDRTVQVWDAITGIKLFTYTRHTDEVFEVAWSPSGKLLASSGLDSTVQLWLWLQ